MPENAQPPKQDSALPMMMRVSQRLVERRLSNELMARFRGWFPDESSPSAIIALRYGKNFLITPEDRPVLSLGREDLVEIADYDPVRNSMLYIGKQAPGKFAVLNWFLFRTYPDVNAVVVLPEDHTPKGGDIKTVPTDLKYINTLACMDALPFFLENKAGVLSTSEAIFLFEKLEEAENVLKAGLSPA